MPAADTPKEPSMGCIVRIAFALVLFVSSTAAAAENAKPKVVFTELVAREPLEATRDAIASEVRASFESTDLFNLIPTATVQKMVAVSPSAACSHVRCASRLGRLVEADFVVVGEVVGQGDAVAVALRVVSLDGTITHRLGFDVRTKREQLTRDVDSGVRSMLGLGVRKQAPAGDRHEIAATTISASPAMPHDWHAAPRPTRTRDFTKYTPVDIEIWNARNEALN